MVHQQTKVVEWDVDEFPFRKKSRDWYWGLGATAVVGAVLSIVFGNYLLTVFIVLAGSLLAVFANKKPKKIHVEISQQGIRVEKNLYPYTNLEAFWIIVKEGTPSLLLLRVSRIIDPLSIIPIGEDINEAELREWFMEIAPEEEMQEPITHRISDKLGF